MVGRVWRSWPRVAEPDRLRQPATQLIGLSALLGRARARAPKKSSGRPVLGHASSCPNKEETDPTNSSNDHINLTTPILLCATHPCPPSPTLPDAPRRAPPLGDVAELRQARMSTVQSYLSPARLANLSDYKYSSVDKSFLSKHVLRHWWVWTASLMPPDLAPNTITMLGFLAVVLNLAGVWIWAGDLGEGGRAAGSWLYLRSVVPPAGDLCRARGVGRRSQDKGLARADFARGEPAARSACSFIRRWTPSTASKLAGLGLAPHWVNCSTTGSSLSRPVGVRSQPSHRADLSFELYAASTLSTRHCPG